MNEVVVGILIGVTIGISVGSYYRHHTQQRMQELIDRLYEDNLKLTCTLIRYKYDRKELVDEQ